MTSSTTRRHAAITTLACLLARGRATNHAGEAAAPAASPPFPVLPVAQSSAQVMSSPPALSYPGASGNQSYLALGMEMPIIATAGAGSTDSAELIFVSPESYLLFVQQGMTLDGSTQLNMSGGLLSSAADPFVSFEEPTGLFSSVSSATSGTSSGSPSSDMRLLAVLLYSPPTAQPGVPAFNWTAWAADMSANPSLRMDFDIQDFASRSGLGEPVAAEVLIVQDEVTTPTDNPDDNSQSLVPISTVIAAAGQAEASASESSAMEPSASATGAAASGAPSGSPSGLGLMGPDGLVMSGAGGLSQSGSAAGASGTGAAAAGSTGSPGQSASESGAGDGDSASSGASGAEQTDAEKGQESSSEQYQDGAKEGQDGAEEGQQEGTEEGQQSGAEEGQQEGAGQDQQSQSGDGQQGSGAAAGDKNEGYSDAEGSDMKGSDMEGSGLEGSDGNDSDTKGSDMEGSDTKSSGSGGIYGEYAEGGSGCDAEEEQGASASLSMSSGGNLTTASATGGAGTSGGGNKNGLPLMGTGAASPAGMASAGGEMDPAAPEMTASADPGDDDDNLFTIGFDVDGKFGTTITAELPFRAARRTVAAQESDWTMTLNTDARLALGGLMQATTASASDTALATGLSTMTTTTTSSGQGALPTATTSASSVTSASASLSSTAWPYSGLRLFCLFSIPMLLLMLM